MRRKKNRPGQTGVNTAGERVDSSGSLPRPESRTAASGRDGEGSGINADTPLAHSRDQSPRPEATPAGGSDVGDSRPSQEVERAHPSPPIPSIPTTEPNSAQIFSFQVLYLNILLGNMNTVAPDHASEGIHPGENTEPSTAANEKKSDWKTTASATAELILRGVRDSADAFGLLKSVAGGLCFILENCEVRSSLTSPVAALTRIPAHEGKRGNDRVVGTPGQSSFRTALQTRFRRRSQGTREAKEIGTVSLHQSQVREQGLTFGHSQKITRCPPGPSLFGGTRKGQRFLQQRWQCGQAERYG